MARGTSTDDLVMLQMALVGYQVERQKIDEKISEIEARLKGKGLALPGNASKSVNARKRVLSAAARRRIAAAQKKRWAAHRRQAALAAKQG